MSSNSVCNHTRDRNKSDSRCAVVRFYYHTYDYRPNWTPLSPITITCRHCGVKTSTVTPSFYYVFNISLPCNINMPSFIGNLWWILLLRNHLKRKGEFILLSSFNCLREISYVLRVHAPMCAR